MFKHYVITICILTCLFKFASGQSLTVGSRAPDLIVKKWYKGAPISQLDPTETYVVEFWATWCGPCRQSIPHLTNLAKTRPDINFIGVSIWEQDSYNRIGNFVKSMGHQMDYHVGYGGDKDGPAQNWMRAAGENGIPTAFLIHKGIVVWIGHPMALDEPLRRISVQSPKVHRSPPSQRTEGQAEGQSDWQKILELRRSGNKRGASLALNELAKKKPESSVEIQRIRFEWLAVDNPEAWETEARELASRADDSGERVLVSFVQSFDHNQTLSVKAMEFLVSGPRNNLFTPWYYASNVFQSYSSRPKALAATRRALSALETSPYRNNQQLRSTLLKRIQDLEQR